MAFRLSGGLALAMFAMAGTVHAQPRITQTADADACRQALIVAKLAFESSAPKLSDAAPLILIDKLATGILLAPDGANGEDSSFVIDETAIERVKVGGVLKEMFLQGDPVDGFRFVVSQQKMNWQGDWYGLYLADAALDAGKLVDLLAPEKVEAAKIVFDRAWQRPWLVRDLETRQIVGIDTQHPAAFLADWIVYKAAGGAVTPACHIAFRPPVEEVIVLLPAGPLRDLVALLDQIVGVPSQSEGTLQPTARVGIAAAQAWANAALRPWAVAAPYNSPDEIERGLKTWSRRSPVFAAQYRRMHALHPRALSALTAHYRATLRKPLAEAAALAKQALDRAVGAYFVFPKGG